MPGTESNEPQLHASQQSSEKRKNKSLDEWQDLVRERIEEAIEQGAFDNLPGKGKPLNLDGNPNEPHEMRMANKLLKNNNLAPSWMLDRRSLLVECEELRAEMSRKWQWYSEEYRAENQAAHRSVQAAEWSSCIDEWEEKIRDLNRRILDLNLSLPIWRMELLRFNLDRELSKIGARRQLNAD